MADYIALRKGRNALSTVTHIALNIALAIVSTALIVIFGSWIPGVLLVLLSKWRVVAVRPRYWWVNIKSNIVDYTVGISLAFLSYIALNGDAKEFTIWHIVLTVIYAIWLVGIKPRSETIMTEVQSMCAIFFGTFATSIMTSQFNPVVGVIICFIIGYGASRHVLMQGDDHDFTLTTFICGLLLAEMSWIFYHWVIVYKVGTTTVFDIPQLPIAASVLFYMFTTGYKSALRHDGKIRADDIVVPALFSVSIILVMIFLFSDASFNLNS